MAVSYVGQYAVKHQVCDCGAAGANISLARSTWKNSAYGMAPCKKVNTKR